MRCSIDVIFPVDCLDQTEARSPFLPQRRRTQEITFGSSAISCLDPSEVRWRNVPAFAASAISVVVRLGWVARRFLQSA